MIIGKNGVKPDPDKVSAVVNMEAPQNVSELRRFLGMVNQLGKFVPNLATVTEPLRALLSTQSSDPGFGINHKVVLLMR